MSLRGRSPSRLTPATHGVKIKGCIPLRTPSHCLMPYAIIRTAGKQYRAEPGKVLRIPSLEGDAGSEVVFDEVLLSSDGNTIKAGAPVLDGAKVTAEIVRHGLADKIVVFKFRRRKNYARKQGHRQGFTEVRIRDISVA
jgi:large subunit ribosomal protein L21